MILIIVIIKGFFFKGWGKTEFVDFNLFRLNGSYKFFNEILFPLKCGSKLCSPRNISIPASKTSFRLQTLIFELWAEIDGIFPSHGECEILDNFYRENMLPALIFRETYCYEMIDLSLSRSCFSLRRKTQKKKKKVVLANLKGIKILFAS